MKKNQIELKIDDPCHEDWDKMTPTEQGRFCKSCSKEVIDFSEMSDADLLRFVNQHKDKEMCGQFYPGQLNRVLHAGYTETSGFNLKAVILGATLTSLLSLESCKSKQVVGKYGFNEQRIEETGHISRREVVANQPLEVHVSGVVSNSNSGEGVEGVTISVLGENGEELVSTVSKNKGKFSYVSHDGPNPATLVLSKSGYQTLNLSYDNLPMVDGKLDIKLVPAPRMLRGKVSGHNVKF